MSGDCVRYLNLTSSCALMIFIFISFRSQFGGPSVLASRIETGDDNDSELNPSSRYGLLSTLYWHLLTGPIGAYVRLFGDAAAWLTTIVGRKMTAIINRLWKK